MCSLSPFSSPDSSTLTGELGPIAPCFAVSVLTDSSALERGGLGGQRGESGYIGMEQVQEQMERLQVTGANVNRLLRDLCASLEDIRVAKLGGAMPGAKWVAPLTASQFNVWESKRVSLNAKRRVGDHVDRILLEVTRLQAAVAVAQQSSYKHAYNKQLQTAADADLVADAKERRDKQDARAEEAAKRSELAAARKRRRVVVDADDDDEDEGFDLR